MQHKETKIIIAICITLLLAASLCIIAETAAAETIGTEQLTFGETPAAAHAEDTLKIPVTISGYPRGINQYAIEIAAQAPGITASDFTISIDKTMIQHTAPSEPAVTADKIQRRYIQTVKMAAFPDYGVEKTPIGTISLRLPETDSAYDAVISARIVESTSGAPLENLAAPKTGDITIHVTPKPAPTPSPKSPLSLITAAAAAAGAAALTISARRHKP